MLVPEIENVQLQGKHQERGVAGLPWWWKVAAEEQQTNSWWWREVTQEPENAPADDCPNWRFWARFLLVSGVLAQSGFLVASQAQSCRRTVAATPTAVVASAATVMRVVAVTPGRGIMEKAPAHGVLTVNSSCRSRCSRSSPQRCRFLAAFRRSSVGGLLISLGVGRH